MFLLHRWAGWKVVMGMARKKKEKASGRSSCALSSLLCSPVSLRACISLSLQLYQHDWRVNCAPWRALWDPPCYHPYKCGLWKTSHLVAMQALLSVHDCGESGLSSEAFVSEMCLCLPLFLCHWTNPLGAGNVWVCEGELDKVQIMTRSSRVDMNMFIHKQYSTCPNKEAGAL